MDANSFTGLAIGLLMGGIRIVSMASAGPMWMYKWFRLQLPPRANDVLSRLRFALKGYDQAFLLRIFSPLKWFVLLVILAWAAGSPINANYCWAYLGTYIGLGTLAIGFGVFKKYRLKLMTYATHEAAHRLGPDLANEMVIPFALASKSAYRLPSIQALRALGTPEAMAALKTLALDPNPEFAAAAQQALDDLQQLFAGATPVLSVDPIEEHAHVHKEILQRFAKTKEAWHQQYDKAPVALASDQIDEIVFSQLPLRRAFPHVYCKKCHARAERKTYEGWEWIRCRKCEDALELTTGIVQVVGQIGADEDWKVADGILKLNLWDDASRQVRIADIDALQIVGGKPINYDWAIAAVVQSLQKHSANPDIKVPVRISLDPPLDPNTHRLLKTLELNENPALPT